MRHAGESFAMKGKHARSKYLWTEFRIRKFRKEGRGTGVGRLYKPWLTVPDIPSRGRSHRFFWEKTGRKHHLLSDLEYYAFLQQAWDDSVEDIREQYPLPRDETIEIAHQLKLRHPRNRLTNTLTVLTTDLLITRRNGGRIVLSAIAVKSSSDAALKRTQQRLNIEREYWERQGIAWQVLTTPQLKSELSRNLDWLYNTPSADETAAVPSVVTLATFFSTNGELVAREACASLDAAKNLSPGSSLASLRLLLKLKRVDIDLHGGIIPERLCSEFLFHPG
jgi:hypothetical protein